MAVWAIKEEPKTAQEFIDYLIEIYGASSVNPKTVTDVKKTWGEWARQGTSEPDNMEEVASDPYAIFCSYFDDIMKACEIKEISPERVYFALIRIKNLNAFANTLPNDDKVIVFDDNLIAFFTAFIITTMLAVYSDPTEQETKELEIFLLSTLNAFHDKEQSQEEYEIYADQFMKMIEKDYELTKIGCYFGMAFTVFVICHELSHHILGHAEEKEKYFVPQNNQAIDSQTETATVSFNTPAYQEEFEADDHGYQLFLELIDKVDQVESAKLSQAFNHSPLMFFEIIEVVDLFARYKGFKNQQSDTHPQPMVRKEYLLSRYKNKLHPDGDELYTGFMGFIDYIKTQITQPA